MSAPTPPPPPDRDDDLAPIDFLAVEFPGAHVSAAGFEQLLSLADQGVIAVLDLEFITKNAAGNASKVDEIAAAIRPGSVAAVIVYENRWVLSLVNTWRRDGARFIADGGISASDIVTALDASESA